MAFSGRVSDIPSGRTPPFDLLKAVIECVGERSFADKQFFGKWIDQVGPAEQPIFDNEDIVLLYVAYIDVPSVRKILAPYFLPALNACTPEFLSASFSRTESPYFSPNSPRIGYLPIKKPLSPEMASVVRCVANQINCIEAYVCLAFTTPSIHFLDIKKLNEVISYLQKNDKLDYIAIIKTLKAQLTALIFKRDYDAIMCCAEELVWAPDDVCRDNINLIRCSEAYVEMDFCFDKAEMFFDFFKVRLTPFYLNLSHAFLPNIRVINHIPPYASFRNALLNGAQIGCNLVNIDFTHASLIGANIRCAKFIGNMTVHADLSGAMIDASVGIGRQLRLVDAMNPLKPALCLEAQGERALRVQQEMQMRFRGWVIDTNILFKWSFFREMLVKKNLNLNCVRLVLPGFRHVDELNRVLQPYTQLDRMYPNQNDLVILRRLLVAAVIDRLTILAQAGVNTQSLYEQALKHPCFQYRDATWLGFFGIGYNASQHELIRDYKIVIEGVRRGAVRAEREIYGLK